MAAATDHFNFENEGARKKDGKAEERDPDEHAHAAERPYGESFESPVFQFIYSITRTVKNCKKFFGIFCTDG